MTNTILDKTILTLKVLVPLTATIIFGIFLFIEFMIGVPTVNSFLPLDLFLPVDQLYQEYSIILFHGIITLVSIFSFFYFFNCVITVIGGVIQQNGNQ